MLTLESIMTELIHWFFKYFLCFKRKPNIWFILCNILNHKLCWLFSIKISKLYFTFFLHVVCTNNLDGFNRLANLCHVRIQDRQILIIRSNSFVLNSTALFTHVSYIFVNQHVIIIYNEDWVWKILDLMRKELLYS